MKELTELCARMADELDHYRQLLMDDRRKTHPLANEARAYLAQAESEEPTDEELDELWAEIDGGGAIWGWQYFARAVLARWGTPANTTKGTH